MEEWDSTDCVGVCGLKQEVDGFRARLPIRKIRARDEGGKVQGDGSTDSGCCEPDAALGFVRIVEVFQTPLDQAGLVLARLTAM